jgi:predicted DNA-binding protein
MAMIYVPDEVISKVLVTGKDKQKYVKEAIEEKLEMED